MIWKNIKLERGINFRSYKEFNNFEDKIDIVPIDNEGRSIIFLNNRIHFYNNLTSAVITPNNDDILKYDKDFNKLVGDFSFEIIKEIFYICGLQIKTKEKNKLDKIIEQLKSGTYGKINNSEYWFLDLYPYIRSISFFSKDRSRSLSVPKLHKENFGGRCIELLSIKMLIIDELPIYQAIHMAQAYISTVHLREVMIDNGIPPNPCMHEKDGKDQKKIFDYE